MSLVERVASCLRYLELAREEKVDVHADQLLPSAEVAQRKETEV